MVEFVWLPIIAVVRRVTLEVNVKHPFAVQLANMQEIVLHQTFVLVHQVLLAPVVKPPIVVVLVVIMVEFVSAQVRVIAQTLDSMAPVVKFLYALQVVKMVGLV